MLGFAIVVMILVQIYKNRLDTKRKASISDFSQYEDYRKLQSNENNQSSSNFSPRK